MSDAQDDSGPVQTPGQAQPVGEPEPAGTVDERADAVDEPGTEADREAAETVRSISRLEESN